MRNIIFITTDTMGRGMCSAYVDRPCVETPSLERLAREGVSFENAFTTCPLCTPARSSWYSGLHPNRSGAWCNNVTMRRGVPLLAELLRGRGYRCAHLGKWHLDGGAYNGGGRADGGFDEDAWYDITNYHEETFDPAAAYPNRFRAWNRGLEDVEYCVGRRVADRAIRIIEERASGDAPLFLAVEFDEPHGPYIRPPGFRGRYRFEDLYRPPTMNASLEGKPAIQREWAAFMRRYQDDPSDLPRYYRKYYECAAYVDSEIGRVIDAATRHLGDDAVVIYTSDHGDHLGAFGLRAKGPTMYDHTTAVPLIVRAPGLAEGGRREDGLVSSVDVWATILDLAGATPSADAFPRRGGYTGSSLVPVLEGAARAVRDHVIIEFDRFGVSHEEDEGLFPIRCVRTAEWKLAINLFDRDELYHVASDPEEEANRIDDPAAAAVRDELHDRLLEWQRWTQDPFRGPRWKMRPWRRDAVHEFEGLFTTGWKDAWGIEGFDE